MQLFAKISISGGAFQTVLRQNINEKERNDMLLNDTELYGRVWDKVYQELNFFPWYAQRDTADQSGKPSFRIHGKYTVFGIENMSDQQIDHMDKIILDIFRTVTSEG